MSDKLLNVSQREAVETIKGPVLVIAGPGSGKTRVIEYRVLNLIEHGIKPESILLLTFTRRASAEMLNRAAEHDPRARKVEGGTFHSFAYKLLKQYGAQVGLPKNLIIMDEDDAQEAVGKIATRLGFLGGDKKFPQKGTLRNIISGALNKNLSIEGILEKEYEHLSQFAGDIERVKKNYAEYKKENGYLDYDDLLFYAREVLKDEQIRNILSQKYEYVMVDEYQDTNKMQGDITYLFVFQAQECDGGGGRRAEHLWLPRGIPRKHHELSRPVQGVQAREAREQLSEHAGNIGFVEFGSRQHGEQV